MSRIKHFKEIVSGQRRGIFSSLLRGCLWLLSFPYAWAVAWRNRRFDQGRGVARANAPVVSIGNLTTGGTGKTPLVCFFAQKLREQNRRVTILSRGYGAGDKGINDEALELEVRLPDVPHLQDPNRKQMADVATEELEAEILLLDDGFQHRRLHREFDLLVVDATEPFGYGYLLPRGLLREPVGNLRRANFVVINRCNFVEPETVEQIKRQIQDVAPEMGIAEANTAAKQTIDDQGNREALDRLTGKKVLAFCGIGNPLGFASTLNDINVELVDSLKEFPDHHNYTRDDIDELRTWIVSHPDADVILCTHKDLVKIGLSQIAGKPLRAVLISIEFRSGEQPLLAAIEEKTRKTAATPEQM